MPPVPVGPGDAGEMNIKYILMAFIAGSVLILDQVTKWIVVQTMPLYHSIEVVPRFAHITYIRNTGAAFGFLAGGRALWRIVFFSVISVLAIGCISYLLKTVRPTQKALIVSLSLILGGALGNLVDRLRMGEVVDFLDLHWDHLHWPAFNVADSAISIGVVLLLIQILRKEKFS